MESARSIIRNIFRAICIVGTIVLIYYCAHEYSLDLDVTHIVYKKFHGDPDGIYPSVTLCFYHPFIIRSLSEWSKNLNGTSYENFLSGYDDGQWNASLSEIDYDYVSIDLLDYLEYVKVNLLNNDNLRWNVENRTKLVANHDTLNYSMVKHPDIYVSARWYNKKCFTINIPFVDNRGIYFMDIKINEFIFEKGIRPRKEEFQMFMHYPYQLMRSLLLDRVNWESNIYTTHCFRLKVRVGSMEVLKRRNKSQAPCNDNHSIDKIALYRMMQDVGCVPNHFKMESELPKCDKRSQYRRIDRLLQDVEEHFPPCNSIERLITDASGYDCSSEDRDLRLTFYFYPTYKEINVLKAYGLQSLVGNAGKVGILLSRLCIAW